MKNSKFFLLMLAVITALYFLTGCRGSRDGYGCKGNSKIMTRVK